MPIEELVGLQSKPGIASIDSLAFDSLVIDLGNLPPNTYRIAEGKLVIDRNQINRLEYRPSNGPTSPTKPYEIESLYFKQVIVRVGDKVYKRYPSYETVNFGVSRYNVLGLNEDQLTYDEMKMTIADLEARINALNDVIEDHLKKQKDDVLQDVVADLNDIRRDFLKIKSYYDSTSVRPPLTQMKTDKISLFNLENAVSSIESQTEDAVHTVILQSDVLFGKGEFTINRPEQQQELNKALAEIRAEIEKVQSRYRDRPVIVRLRITGYADDLKISDDKAKELNCPGVASLKYDTDLYQDSLNACLSKRRGESVNKWLTSKLTGIPGNIKLKPSVVIGAGRTNAPPGVEPCSGDCSQRRVVRVSHIEFPDWH